MKDYAVVYEGTVRQVYIVEAESEDEAREKWSGSYLASSEMIEGGVVEVSLDE